MQVDTGDEEACSMSLASLKGTQLVEKSRVVMVNEAHQ